MKLFLVRHGLTQGNLESRYIGCRTDEPLCARGEELLRARHMPAVSRLLVSPMKRCIQSAAILWPGMEPEIVPNLRECDFGSFEGKNYQELNGNSDYQAWIDSGGELPFPGGESRQSFALRSVNAFRALDLFSLQDDCALVVHGGTIMAIMEAYARPRGSYFDFLVKCGEGFVLWPDGSHRSLEETERYTDQ
ncbi:MAG: histidine phosphatase family protein [Clostridia bacterium]|nr:histidine phosphatase family protein [Clostridia bacterium]